MSIPRPSVLALPSPGDESPVQAHRWLLLLGAVTVVGCWWPYQILSPAVFDPLWLRFAVGGVFAVALAGTYLADWFRRHVWGVTLAGSVVMNVYFGALGVLNGFGEAWVVGILASTTASVIGLTLKATSTKQVWIATLASLGATGGSFIALGADSSYVGLVMFYAVLLAMLAAVAAVAQVRLREAHRAERDAAAAGGRLLQAVLDAIPNGLYVVDREGSLVTANSVGTAWAPADSVADLAGQPVADVFSPVLSDVLLNGLDRALGGGAAAPCEVRTAFPDGSPMTARVLVTPFLDDHDAVSGGVCLVYDLTAERTARAAADESAALARATLEAAPDMVVVVDQDDVVLEINAALTDALGFTGEDLVGRSLADAIVPAPFRGEHRAKLRRYADVGEVGSLESRLRLPVLTAAGEAIPTELTFRPIRLPGGRALFTMYMRDLRAQLRAEADLVATRDAAEQQRRLLRTVIDTVPDLIFAKDLEGRAILRNLANARAFGSDDPEALVGLTEVEAYPHNVLAAKYHADDMRVIRTGEPLVDIEETIEIDGEERWLLTTKVPLRDAGGAVVGLVGTARDITEAKAAQAALVAARDEAQAGQRLIRTVIDAIPDMIFVTDRDGRCVLRNAADARTLGYDDPEDTLGLTVFDTVPAEHAQALWEIDRQVMESGVARLDADDWVGIDGQDRVFRSSKVPLLDEAGAVTGMVGLVRDVTDARASEAALVEARDAAEAATRAKSEFLANMSHEIRTPMNGVIGMTSLLLDTPLDTEQRDFVETIRVSGDALLTLINDILDFSKIEAGMLDLEEAPFDVRDVLESALDLVAPTAAEKGIELAYIVGETVPQTARGDASRIRQVLVNLLSNAVKFTPAGSVCVRADAAMSGGGPSTVRLRVTVEDTGIGIPANKLEAVFGSFEQADASTTRQFGGTGLGLTICRRLVEMMGGAISVESVVGEGSTFTFSVVVGVVPTARRVFLRAEQPVLAGRRMLVVDDNDVNREILIRLAARWQMEVEAFASGQAAIDAVAAGARFDVAVLDMQMPDLDGLGTARALRALDGAPPHQLLLTSINRDAALRDAAVEAGIERVLYKPAKPAQIHDALEEAFRAPSAQGAAWVAGPRRGAPPAPAPARPASTLRILVAEDNVVNQKVATRILQKLGYAADLASNGAEALAALHRQPYDVVLMDVQMPEMDGLEATRRLRAEMDSSRQPVVIALTANAMTGDRETCLAAGCNAYLSKPIQTDALAAALAEVAAGVTA